MSETQNTAQNTERNGARRRGLSILGVVVVLAGAAYGAKQEPTLFEAERDRRVSLYILKP